MERNVLGGLRMSVVLNFFENHPLPTDEVHNIIRQIPTLQARFPGLRQAMLGCCGAERAKDGSVRLVVVDIVRWNELADEQAAITKRLDAINSMVETLDTIFAEIEAEGITIYRKTLSGIWSEESGHRTRQFDPHTGTEYDRWGKKIPALQDARFLDWTKRAEAAMAEAGLGGT